MFSGHQRAIGELLITARTADSGEPQRECIGYGTFVDNLREPMFARWFEGLRADVAEIAAGGDKSRLIILQNRLVDILDELDEGGIRFPRHRERLALAE